MSETINVEKYAEALNNLVGMDIEYLGDSDESVNAIVEVINVAIALEKKVRELTEENEMLRTDIKDLEEDYERVYEQAEADIHGNMADGGTSCHWCADKTKADTIKEFADRVKKLIIIPPLKQEIDKIVKEMLEENK